MNRLSVIVQSVTLVGVLGLGAHQASQWWAARSAAAEVEVLSAAALERGRSLLAADRFSAAALALGEAAAVGGAAGRTAWLAARRAEALAAVSAPSLPEPSTWPRLDALAERLEASALPEDTALAPVLRLALLRARGQRAEAVTLAGELSLADEKSPWFQWHAGALRLEEGRVPEAQALLEALARQRPRFGPGLHRLGLSYAAGGRLEAAVEALQRANAAGAGAEAALDLGRLFMKREMWAEAIVHLENGQRGGAAAGAEAVRLLAAAHFHLKRYDLAAQTYRRAHGLEPDPRTLLSAAIALTAAERHAEALEALTALSPHATAVPEVLFQEAVVRSALGQSTREVLARYLEVARGRPDEADRVARAEAALAGVVVTPNGAGSPPQRGDVPRAPRARSSAADASSVPLR